MKYVSTRGQAPVLEFEDALLTGLARDGGLYVPQTWPVLSADDLRALRGKPYAEVALAVIKPFVGDSLPADRLSKMIDEAYATFGHPAVTPLKQLDANQWLLELFHGPTLAFKDVAMQLLSRLMDWALEQRGARATIVGATSGDTGGAAIDAFLSRGVISPAGKRAALIGMSFGAVVIVLAPLGPLTTGAALGCLALAAAYVITRSSDSGTQEIDTGGPTTR